MTLILEEEVTQPLLDVILQNLLKDEKVLFFNMYFGHFSSLRDTTFALSIFLQLIYGFFVIEQREN